MDFTNIEVNIKNKVEQNNINLGDVCQDIMVSFGAYKYLIRQSIKSIKKATITPSTHLSDHQMCLIYGEMYFLEELND